MDEPAPIILILGPTAGGKTRLAIDLARTLPGGGECLCADSMQVYRGMDIGTAKPTAGERAAAPHHLLDLVDPDDERFSVDAWLNAAERAIADVRARGRFPIVVGGTNLYVQALLAGLDAVPEPDAALRARLLAMNPAELRRRLQAVDPAAAERIHANDVRRTVRAIEVFERSGRPISAVQSSWSAGHTRPDARLVGLEWPVEAINRRINRRVREMIESGLVQEVRGLWEAGRLGVQAREALGYKQLVDHLEGRSSLEEALEQIKIRTRRFAKQQRTWLRRFSANPRARWLPAAELSRQEITDKALTFSVMPLADLPQAAPKAPDPGSPEQRGP